MAVPSQIARPGRTTVASVSEGVKPPNAKWEGGHVATYLRWGMNRGHWYDRHRAPICVTLLMQAQRHSARHDCAHHGAASISPGPLTQVPVPLNSPRMAVARADLSDQSYSPNCFS